MPGKPVIGRYLDPAESLAEVLFGLIMVLTLTIGGRIVMTRDMFDSSEFVMAVIGGNVAWGVIDGVLFVLGTVFYRSRRARFFRSLRNAPSQTEAMATIQEEFGLDEEPLITRPEDRARLHHSILEMARNAEPARVRVSRDDVVSGLIVFALVSATAIPGVIPFLVLADPGLAFRVSNVVLVLLLFLAGYWWAHFTEANQWGVGFTVMSLGLAMVGLAIAFGG